MRLLKRIKRPVLPKPELIARQANRLRQRLRPNEPVDPDFSLEEQHLPDEFLRADLNVRGRRHLVFATNEQLHYLSRAKTWYIDGTFKLVRHPFTQLLTIIAFVRKDDHAKQVPLVFVIMSGKKKDYREVRSLFSHVYTVSNGKKQICGFSFYVIIIIRCKTLFD